MDIKLSSKIEAILFWKAEPVKIDKLASMLKCDVPEIVCALTELESLLLQGGLSLVRSDDSVMLGTSPQCASIIADLTKEELTKDLGKAGLETLAIILYQGPITRAEIDYIRGVNSQFIVRNLMIRGLVDRIDNPTDSRSFLYKPSIDLIAHLGIANISNLPDFEKIKSEIDSFKNAKIDK